MWFNIKLSFTFLKQPTDFGASGGIRTHTIWLEARDANPYATEAIILYWSYRNLHLERSTRIKLVSLGWKPRAQSIYQPRIKITFTYSLQFFFRALIASSEHSQIKPSLISTLLHSELNFTSFILFSSLTWKVKIKDQKEQVSL